MKLFTVLIVLFSSAGIVTAAPVVTGIEPPFGFTFAPTHVILHGSGFADSPVLCAPVGCGVTVSFGKETATVLAVAPDQIKVVVNPQPAGVVDVRVAVTGTGETILPGAFRFDPYAIGGPEDYVRYLAPVIQRDLPGAFLSLWTTELKFRNRWTRAIPIVVPFNCLGTCGAAPIPGPQETTTLFLPPRNDGGDGALVYVPISSNDPKPAMTLRVRDLSKNSTSFGTEVHMPQADEYQRQIDLIGIPTDARYRATLRIYGSNEKTAAVRVRTFSEPGDEQIDVRIVTLSGIEYPFDVRMPLIPAYLQLDPLTPSVRGSGDRVRVAIDNLDDQASPASPKPPIWAFITITDNVTQLVSTITPSR